MNTFSSQHSQVFSQNVSELWSAISIENNLNDTHPFCKENRSIEWSGDVHKDILVYLNGTTYVRDFSG